MKLNRYIKIFLPTPTIAKVLSRVSLIFCFFFISCVKDFDINIKPNKQLLVVEGYINNLVPEYNYVVLSQSLDYLSTNFQSTPVSQAIVFITEGEFSNNQYNWNISTKTKMTEGSLPSLPINFKSGVYIDPKLVTDPPNALRGSAGKAYLLEIDVDGRKYSAITSLLQPVPIDSLTLGFNYIDEENNNVNKIRITNHYKDPDTLNNTQFYYYRFFENRSNFGWGGLSRSRTAGTDDLTNGEYMHLTHPRGFVAPDTVTYYMASVTRDVYNFWDTFNKARNNNGPFATPVTLGTNINGTDVTGCFSGLSLSSKSILIK